MNNAFILAWKKGYKQILPDAPYPIKEIIIYNIGLFLCLNENEAENAGRSFANYWYENGVESYLLEDHDKSILIRDLHRSLRNLGVAIANAELENKFKKEMDVALEMLNKTKGYL